MSLLGLVCFVLAALDAATIMLGLSFTSVGWSPVIFVLLGGLFLTGPATEIPGSDRPGGQHR